MRIKICGLKRPEDIACVNRHRPDWVGFVFAGTKRRVDAVTAARLKRLLHPALPAVGVFVNEDIDAIVPLVTSRTIDMVQLHGDEDASFVARLRAALARAGRDVPLIRAVRVQTREQVLAAAHLPVDYVLLDTFKASEYGGSGTTFDHTLIPPQLPLPWILAGGMTSDNMAPCMAALRERGVALPCCIDLSSSVETDGVKDCAKIGDAVAAVRALPRETAGVLP